MECSILKQLTEIVVAGDIASRTSSAVEAAFAGWRTHRYRGWKCPETDDAVALAGVLPSPTLTTGI